MWIIVGRFAQHLLIVMMYANLFRSVDTVLVRAGLKGSYHMVHALHTTMIVLLTATNVWSSFATFYAAYSVEPHYAAATLCYALHYYYIARYWRIFRFDDWLHHGLMIGVALPLFLQLRVGTLLISNLFFTTGLPGAISYGLLFAGRNNRLVSRLAVATNVWIPAPGCMLHATLTILLLTIAPPVMTAQLMSLAVVAILTAWNGLYFMQQSIRSYAVAHALTMEAEADQRHVE